MISSRDLRSPAAANGGTSSVSRRTLLKRTAGTLAIVAVPTFAMTDPVRGAEIQPGDTVEVIDGPLNLREGPGLGYEVIIAFSVGTRVRIGDGPIVADSYTWGTIVPGGDAPSGCLAAEFLREVGTGDPEDPRVEVVAGPLYVRVGAGLAADVISSVPVGTQGTARTRDSVSSDGYSWALVAFDSGLEG